MAQPRKPELRSSRCNRTTNNHQPKPFCHLRPMTENAWIALEWSSAVLGAAYTFLAAFEKRIAWIFAVVSSVMFVVYYFHRNYTGQVVLNAYYVIMGFYGWFSWGRDTASIPVTRKPLTFHAVMLVGALLCT